MNVHDGPDNEYLTKDRVKYIIHIYVNDCLIIITMNRFMGNHYMQIMHAKILYFRENLCLSSLTSFFESVRESEAHRMKYL